MIHSRPFRWLAGACLLLLSGTQARADHSLGNACTACHSLRSSGVVAGTRNIKSSLIIGFFPYAANWYCPGSTVGPLPSSTIGPRANLTGVFALTTPISPLDCSYCHKQGQNDIGTEIGNASDLVAGGGVAAKTASAHPVDTKASTKVWGDRRIACNQCHNDDVGPTNLCDKGTNSGYPNHKGTLSGKDPTTLGLNQRTGTAAHLRLSYEATSGAGWTTTDGILCFDCHKASGLSNVDVKTDYDKVNGGHNIIALDSDTAPTDGAKLEKKLPCYNCHDPHGVARNAKLIIETKDKIVDPTKQNPFGTSYSATNLPPTLYDGTNDRAVCYGCHKGSTVEGRVLPDVLATGWVPTAFPFHANAHDGLGTAGNCLQKNGGCHQGPHDTNLFRCLDCHSKAVTDAMAAKGATVPARLLAVNHVDSEFAHIGQIGPVVESSTANRIQSVHSIPYSASAAVDMAVKTNNGCLYCHDTRGKGMNAILAGGGPSGTPVLTGSRTNTFTSRELLEHFDPFCLSCHDGASGRPTFKPGADYYLSDGGTGNVKFAVGTNDLYPPRVNNDQTLPNTGTGYHYTAGHGRGLLSSPTGNYSSGLPSPATKNDPAKIPCLECHLYHGSTAYKLLPGWRETKDLRGHVVKGGTYLLKSSGKEVTGIANPIGGVPYSTVIDYADHTNTSYARSLSDYTNNDFWSSYGHTSTPTGTPTPFGTAGDVFGMACNAEAKDYTTYNADGTGSTTRIGFCNVCHLYDNGTSSPTDGTVSTYGVAYTHQGDPALKDCPDPPGRSLGSKRTFARDCLECHDPHGSGTDSTSGTANLFMIRQRLKNTASTWVNVVFTSRTGAGSFDVDDTAAANPTEICNVCHTQLTHSNLTPGGAKHQTTTDCTDCHNHGVGQ